MSSAWTREEKAEYDRIQSEIRELRRKLKGTSSPQEKKKLQQKIDALVKKAKQYTNPIELTYLRRAKARRRITPEQRAAYAKAVRTGKWTDAWMTPPFQSDSPLFQPKFTGQQQSSQPYVPMYQQFADQNTNQTGTSHESKQTASKPATTASRRRTGSSRTRSGTRARTVQSITPLENSQLERVVRMTPTYLRNFLVQANIISEEESNNNRSSNKLRELIRGKLASLTDAQKNLLDRYVTQQDAQINTHWSEIRTSGGNADDTYDMTREIMKKDAAAAQHQVQEQVQAIQAPRESIGEKAWNSLPQDVQAKIVALTTQPQPQKQQPRYENLPQNLINAVQAEPEKMLAYFERHSRTCGGFPKDQFKRDENVDTAGMLNWLNKNYPGFKDSRKHKIDVACRRRSPEPYIAESAPRVEVAQQQPAQNTPQPEEKNLQSGNSIMTNFINDWRNLHNR